MKNKPTFSYIEYSMSTKSIDIFITGCSGSCKGCCNPEIKSWNIDGLSCKMVLDKCGQLNKQFDRLVTRFFLVGGDLVDNTHKYPQEVIEFVQELKSLNKPIYLFTHYELNEIPRELLDEIDYVKTGRYLPELTCDNNICYGIKLATSNQKIWKKGVDFQ